MSCNNQEESSQEKGCLYVKMLNSAIAHVSNRDSLGLEGSSYILLDDILEDTLLKGCFVDFTKKQRPQWKR